MPEQFNFGPQEETPKEKEIPEQSPEEQELAEMYKILPIEETLELLPGMGLKEFFLLKAKALGLTFEEYQSYMQWELEQRKSPVKELREVKSEEITMLETLFEQFEGSHSLAELNEITDLSPELSSLFRHNYDIIEAQRFEEIESILSQLSPEEQRNYKKRLAAKEALIPVRTAFDKIGRETNISPDEYRELKRKMDVLEHAIGMISGNRVEHDR